MNLDRLRDLLEEVKCGEVDVEAAIQSLRHLPFEDLGFSKVDHHRQLRTGFPEVIFSQGKTVDQVKEISKRILAAGHLLLATRATPEIYDALASLDSAARFNELGRTITIGKPSGELHDGILVVSLARPIFLWLRKQWKPPKLWETGWNGYTMSGLPVCTDCSVPSKTNPSRVLVVVAGMEGALASVVGGLVDKPVIAVPTSIGYGASFGGVAALLSMLNSCASGVTAVNIDNGFGGGYSASLINQLHISK